MKLSLIGGECSYKIIHKSVHFYYKSHFYYIKASLINIICEISEIFR